MITFQERSDASETHMFINSDLVGNESVFPLLCRTARRLSDD